MSEIQIVDVQEIAERRKNGSADFVLLDVRKPEELELAKIDGAVHIPMQDIPYRIGELNPEDEIVVFCHKGKRSLNVCNYLMQEGFANCKSLRGGIDAWAEQIDPTVGFY
ncbi:MAG: rhodanese-like domain-containing protein [Phycisphaerae bacterium]